MGLFTADNVNLQDEVTLTEPRGLPLCYLALDGIPPTNSSFKITTIADITLNHSNNPSFDVNNPETESTTLEDTAIGTSEGYVYRIDVPTNLEIAYLESNNTEYSNARNPLQLKHDTYFRYLNTLYICSQSLLSTVDIGLRLDLIIGYFSPEGQSVLDLSRFLLSSVKSVTSKGLNIKPSNLANATEVSYTFNTSTKLLTIDNNERQSLSLYDPVIVLGDFNSSLPTYYLRYTLFDYSSLASIFSIKAIEHNSVNYYKTLDKTKIRENTLFFNKYTHTAIGFRR